MISPRLVERLAAAAVLVPAAALPVVALGILRLFPALELGVAPGDWVAAAGATTAAVAAAAAAVGCLASGLRTGIAGRILLAAAAAMLAATSTLEALAALGDPTARPAPGIAVGWVAASALLLAAGAATIARLRIAGVGGRLALAAVAFGAVEAVVLAAGWLALERAIDPYLLSGAAAGALLATALGAGRLPALPILLTAVAALVLALARSGSADLLVADATVVAAMLGLLRWSLLVHVDRPEQLTDRDRVAELIASLPTAALLFDGRLRLQAWSPEGARLFGIDRQANGAELQAVTGLSLEDLRTLTTDSGAPAARVERGDLAIELEPLPIEHGLVILAGEPAADEMDAAEHQRLGRELRATIEELLRARRTIELQRAEIERGASSDELTGVASRSAILERLRGEVAQARRYAHPVAVLLLDIDHMASVNRDCGVEGGDQVLREIALRMRLRVREADALGRSAADAFLAILPHTDEAGAATFADALRRRITQRPVATGQTSLAVTVSIGVAIMRAGEPIDADALMARADEALASAVAAGGDRIAFDRLHGLARLEGRGDRPAEPPPGEHQTPEPGA